jgi:hypothetical protein
MKAFRLFLLMLSLVSLTGCASFGPGAIKQSRGGYNIAVQQTGNEQLLLNIVRLKYRDTPTFLELTSITTSFAFTAGGEIEATLQDQATTPVTLIPSVSWSDKPTVTYTPLQGDRFVSQIMSPLDLDTLPLLYHSGWSVERILALTSQSLNGLENAPTASGPTPARKPRFEEFRRAVQLLRELQVERVLRLGLSDASEGALELSIRAEAAQDPRLAELRRLLGLAPERLRYPVIAGVGAQSNAITVNLRSLMGVLFYVSQAVEVPERDREAGRVTRTLDENGAPFDWTMMLRGLVHVRSAMTAPENAYVAVPYRGVWFYIDDSDLTSKSTFALLTQLSALAAGDVKTSAPVLTLPIGN